MDFAEEVRHLLTKNGHTRTAYELLHKHVARHNPHRDGNVERLLQRCGSELTKTIIRFLAEIDTSPADQSWLEEIDLPSQIAELEPNHCTPLELSRFERDLNEMTIRALGWGLLTPNVPANERRRAPPESKTV
jgi:hypothetical protein